MPDAAGVLAIALVAVALGLLAVWALSTVRRGQPLLTRTGTALVPLPPQQCVRAVADVVAQLPNVRSVSHSPHELSVEARTHGSARSFGEDITVETSVADGGSRVDVQSRPAVWAVTIDYGTNRRNVRDVLEAIVGQCGGEIVDSSAEPT